MSGLRAELERVLGLCEKATAGPWEVKCSPYTKSLAEDHFFVADCGNTTDRVYLVGPISDSNATGAFDAETIAAAVNFLRQYGPALLTGQGEDGRDAQDAVRYRWLRDSDDRAWNEGHPFIGRCHGGRFSRWNGEAADAAIDAARESK